MEAAEELDYEEAELGQIAAEEEDGEEEEDKPPAAPAVQEQTGAGVNEAPGSASPAHEEVLPAPPLSRPLRLSAAAQPFVPKQL